jgi:glycerol-3-phosphate dehydrogenase
MLIVGGGIVGVATARDAAMRGFKVACVEKEDYAYGTSSRSSKLIHGGLRYLEQANFKLVFEGTHERSTLGELAPHLVRPIQFLVPVYTGSKHGRLALGMGLWLYDALAGRHKPGKHSRHAPAELGELEPLLDKKDLNGGALYYDCMTDDARLCVENAVGAHEAGAVMLTRTSFMRPIRGEGDVVVGAVVHDHETGKDIEVSAKSIVHCAGPWTDEVLRRSGDTAGMIRTSKGAHICFAHDRLPLRYAVVMSAVRDGRVVFAIPRGRVTLVGTTDTDYDGDPDEVCASKDDVDYLIETVGRYFPRSAITRADVRATYAGLRPLIRDNSENPYDTSREHTVVARPDRSVTIGGGKYTTYRRIADDVVKATMGALAIPTRQRPKCTTKTAPLPGALGLEDPSWAESQKARLSALGIAPDVQQYVLGAYGTRVDRLGDGLTERLVEGFPFTLAEIDHAVLEEDATAIDDVLVRRIPIFFEVPDQGLECLEKVADRMKTLLGWHEATRREQIDHYRGVVARSRRWKSEA